MKSLWLKVWAAVWHRVKNANWAEWTTAIVAVVLAFALPYQVPHLFGWQANLVWHDDPRNSLKKDDDERMPTQNTVTVTNTSSFAAARDVYVKMDLVDESPISLKSSHAVEQVSLEGYSKTLLIKQIPPRGTVTFTVGQNVEFFPGEDNPDHPRAIIYQYAPTVESISSADGDAIRLTEKCKYEVERYDSDRLGKYFRKYEALCKFWEKFSVGLRRENGEVEVAELGKEHAEQHAKDQAERVRIGGKVKKQKAFALKLEYKNEQDAPPPPDEPIPIPEFDSPMITIEESGLNKMLRYHVAMCCRYLEENPEVAKRWLEEFPEWPELLKQTQAFLDDPDAFAERKPPKPEGEFFDPWETVPRYVEANPEVGKRWLKKYYPDARKYLDEIKDAKLPFPPKLTIPPPWTLAEQTQKATN